jgi:hypothetical protein
MVELDRRECVRNSTAVDLTTVKGTTLVHFVHRVAAWLRVSGCHFLGG